jgi:FtsP/CotA-like multicopper oxidase with cupredoxin domain
MATLGPGNRVDLMVDMIGGPGHVIPLAEVSGERQELVRLVFHASERKRAEPLVAPMALAPNTRLREPDRKDALAVPLVMTGGGKSETDMSIMMGSGPVWQFNGKAGMMMTADGAHAGMGQPLFRAPNGRSVHIRIENKTAWPHAMHLHGHHFRLLERSDGQKPQPFWWDTLLVQPGETSTIGFVADNPGKWMLHCHMLDHQASGMDAWFEVG